MRPVTTEKAGRTDAHVAGIRALDAWFVEGAFGEYPARFLGDADTLIWLDVPGSRCRDWILAGGPSPSVRSTP